MLSSAVLQSSIMLLLLLGRTTLQVADSTLGCRQVRLQAADSALKVCIAIMTLHSQVCTSRVVACLVLRLN